MRLRELAADRDLVVFGALRSGSTLLRLMINAHPSLSCNGEHDYLFDHVHFDTSSNTWTFDRKRLLLDRIFINNALVCPDTNDAALVIRDLIDQLCSRNSGRLVLMIHRNLDKAISLLNDPLIVHLIRDPRDVAASSIGMGWSGNVYYGVDHWINTEKEWSRCAPALDGACFTTLRFEELIADPTAKLTDLCQFLCVAYSPEMLEYHRSTTYEPVDPRLASQWQTKRSKKEIGLIELRTGALLKASGYEPSDLGPIKLGLFEKGSLWLNNKTYNWRVRIERYGLLDPLWVAIARRLGVETWAKPATLRIHERTKRYLK